MHNPIERNIPENILVAFDLDDTLYKERNWAIEGYKCVGNYLQSQYGLLQNEVTEVMSRALALRGNPFDALAKWASEHFNIDLEPEISNLLWIYRYHPTSVQLPADSFDTLSRLLIWHVPTALVTDGRCYTQKEKIECLGLHIYFPLNMIFISGCLGKNSCKKDDEVFRKIMEENSGCIKFYYVGDNPAKDFRIPSSLGWTTVMLRDVKGENIHPQTDQKDGSYYPADHGITRLEGLFDIICQ